MSGWLGIIKVSLLHRHKNLSSDPDTNIKARQGGHVYSLEETGSQELSSQAGQPKQQALYSMRDLVSEK